MPPPRVDTAGARIRAGVGASFCGRLVSSGGRHAARTERAAVRETTRALFLIRRFGDELLLRLCRLTTRRTLVRLQRAGCCSDLHTQSRPPRGAEQQTTAGAPAGQLRAKPARQRNRGNDDLICKGQMYKKCMRMRLEAARGLARSARAALLASRASSWAVNTSWR
jgi:hypothetical protein